MAKIDYEQYSKDDLIRLLRERDRKPKLGLVWERDEIEHDNSLNNDFVVLKHDPELSCGSDPYTNFIIEGDNFDALRYLKLTHSGSVKCIYIDPPYNTGNRDFIYNDRYLDKDDAYRHSKWLEFMYRRLVIAKDLLAEDGVIFVSINDIEHANLKLLMDRLFGEKNCLANLVWHTDGNFDNQARFKVCHEYVLVYAVNEGEVPPPPVIDPNADESGKLFREEIRNTIVKNGPKNPVSDITLPAGFPADFQSGIIKTRTDKWPQFLSDAVVENGRLTSPVVIRSGWANKKLCEHFIASGYKPVLDTKNQATVFVLTETGAVDNVKIRKQDQSHVVTVIKNVGSVQASGSALEGRGINFSYPKPVGLLTYLLSMIRGDDFTVLDFFAGSGTTAHAVMQLNKNDGGSRKYIMVSSTEATIDSPDMNLCRDACAKRVRLAAEELNDMGFAYMRTHRIPLEQVFNEIQHDQVWFALQLMHFGSIQPYAKDLSFQTAGDETVSILYVPRLDDCSITEIESLCGTNSAHIAIYSWQPGLLRQRITKSNVTFEAIPQYLVDRFAAGGAK